jgi:predicted ester cyclase
MPAGGTSAAADRSVRVISGAPPHQRLHVGGDEVSSGITDSWRRFVAAFNANSPDEIADVVAAEFVDHHVPPELPRGLDGVRLWWDALHHAFDCRLEVDDVVEGTDRLASRMTFTGVHTGEFQGLPATGRSFSASFMSIDRFAGGQLVERWEVGDTLGILQQLGAIPAS